MPEFVFLNAVPSVSVWRGISNLFPELSKSLSSLTVFLIDSSSRAAASASAAYAFAGGSPGSPLMAVAA
jgi:hypothetical protein